MKWSVEKTNDWYKKTGQVVGVNYVTSTAVNSTEMWMKGTFDRETIRRELALASSVGFNSCRVFLQYLVWKNERDSFLKNLADFCDIAGRCGLSVMPVLFDDCAFAGKEPYWGIQDAPKPGVHNSGWTPSPGSAIANDPDMEESLSEYVKGVIGEFKDSRQIIIWDLYNEPGNNNRSTKCLPLMERAFAWAREIDPAQPLTIGIWDFKEYEFSFAQLSDVITYHSYTPVEDTRKKVEILERYDRPILCTEWLCRAAGSNFESHLPLFLEKNIGFYNWGLFAGKCQTNLDWSTVTGEPDANPAQWQHDLFYPDGRPYNEDEIALLMQVRTRRAKSYAEDSVGTGCAASSSSCS